MLSDNPFDHQNPTRPEHFLDRTEDRARLRAAIDDGVNLLIYGPRRRGKTSLIMRVLADLDDPVSIYVDATHMRHPGDLGSRILSGLGGTGIGKARRFQRWAAERLSGLDIEVGANASGAYVRLRSGTRATTGLVHALEFLERIGEAAGRRILVCMDEFQVAMREDGLVDAIRSVAQHQQHVQYVFSGSEPSILADLNQDKASPFYQQLQEIRIDGLSIHDLREDSERLLGHPLTGEAADRIDALVADDTKRVIHILRHAWQQSDGSLGAIDAAIDAAIEDMRDAYEVRLGQIQSPLHRQALFALAVDGTAHPTASGFIQKHDLRSGSHVQRALAALRRLHILDENNHFYDGLFQEFLRR